MKGAPVMGEYSFVCGFKGVFSLISKKLVQKRTRIKTINPQNNTTVTSVWNHNREMTCQELRNHVNWRGKLDLSQKQIGNWAILRFFPCPNVLKLFLAFFGGSNKNTAKPRFIFSGSKATARVVERREGQYYLFLRKIRNRNFDFHVFESFQFVFRKEHFLVFQKHFWNTLPVKGLLVQFSIH